MRASVPGCRSVPTYPPPFAYILSWTPQRTGPAGPPLSAWLRPGDVSRMPNRSPLLRTTVALAGIASLVCSAAAAQATADSRHPPYTAADVHFMSGMIHHHAQAVLIAGWAPSHDASPSLRALGERIVVCQPDEIGLMRRCHHARHEDLPDSNPGPTVIPGMDHTPMMPGRLTPEPPVQLERA